MRELMRGLRRMPVPQTVCRAVQMTGNDFADTHSTAKETLRETKPTRPTFL